jgi:hypothetical protein
MGRWHDAHWVARTGATTPHPGQIGVRGSASIDEAIELDRILYDSAVKLFSSDGSPAIVGVGQEATAIFAVAQVARGFIAIGQLAVGVFTVGQLCVSVVGLGQAGGGVSWFAGMVGVGGRGFCLRLIPGIDPPRIAPKVVPFEALLQAGPGAEGFVHADVVPVAGTNGAALGSHGSFLPVKPTPTVAWALANAQRLGTRTIFAHIKRAGAALVCDRLVEVPGTRKTYGTGFQIVRVVLLAVLATAWWYVFRWVSFDS